MSTALSPVRIAAEQWVSGAIFRQEDKLEDAVAENVPRMIRTEAVSRQIAAVAKGDEVGNAIRKSGDAYADAAALLPQPAAKPDGTLEEPSWAVKRLQDAAESKDRLALIVENLAAKLDQL